MARIRPLLVVLIGLPGAGKTTFATRLRERERAWLHLDRDAIRGRAPGDAARRAATEETFRRARRALHARRNVLLDGMTFATQAARRRARALARSAGAACIEVFLDTPVEVAAARIKKSGAGHPAPDRDVALLERVAARFARVKPR